MPDRVISVPQAAQIATRIKNKFDNVNGRLTLLDGTANTIVSSVLTNGYWSARQIVSTYKMVCVKELIKVNAGDKIIVTRNPDNLYMAYGVYEGDNTSTTRYTGFFVANPGEYEIHYTGELALSFSTAATLDGASSITPETMTCVVGVLRGVFTTIADNSEAIAGIQADAYERKPLGLSNAFSTVQINNGMAQPSSSGNRLMILFVLGKSHWEASISDPYEITCASYISYRKALVYHTDYVECISYSWKNKLSGDYNKYAYQVLSVRKKDNTALTQADINEIQSALNLEIVSYTADVPVLSSDMDDAAAALTNGVVTMGKDDAIYIIRAATSSEALTDNPNGTRIRIVFDVRNFVPFNISIDCEYGRGVNCNLYETVGDCVRASPNYKEAILSETYSHTVNADCTKPGFLSVSLCKSDSSVFTDADVTEALAALNITLTKENPYNARFESVESDISRLSQLLEKKTSLYIGRFLQKRGSAGGYADDTDTLTPYRVTMANTIALPCGSKRKLYGSLGENYVCGIMFGARSDNLNHNLYWFSGEFEVDVPDGDNFYRVSVANADDSGNNRHDKTQITPTEDFKLKVYCHRDFNPLYVNDSGLKKLSSARLSYANNTIGRNAVIAHMSDVHGDYYRLKNMYDVCDEIGVDCVCTTGDIVGYKPSNGLDWYHDVINSSNSLSAICTGNHDVYNDSWADEDVYSFMFAPVAEKIGNTTGKTWYYTDIVSKKLRIMSINLYQYGGESRWYTHFTEEQLQWFVNSLLSVPSGYGVIVLMHAPQSSLSADSGHTTFWQTNRKYNNTHNSVSGGVPVYDIIDAFISKTTLSKTYTQTGSPSSVSVSADFSNVASSEFIAYMTGHFHQDSITYVSGRTNKQLMLNVTCGIGLYGGTQYPYYADISDIARECTSPSQDAFNAYVIDRDAKMVKVVRIGSNQTYDITEREYMSIAYATQAEVNSLIAIIEGGD